MSFAPGTISAPHSGQVPNGVIVAMRNHVECGAVAENHGFQLLRCLSDRRFTLSRGDYRCNKREEDTVPVAERTFKDVGD